MGYTSILFLRECDCCHSREERVFDDSWTGLALCPMCLAQVLNQVTCSPSSEGDNLRELLHLTD